MFSNLCFQSEHLWAEEGYNDYEYDGHKHHHYHDQQSRDWHQYDSDSPEHHQEVKAHLKGSMQKIMKMKATIDKVRDEHGSVRKGYVKGANKAAVKKAVISNVVTGKMDVVKASRESPKSIDHAFDDDVKDMTYDSHRLAKKHWHAGFLAEKEAHILSKTIKKAKKEHGSVQTAFISGSKKAAMQSIKLKKETPPPAADEQEYQSHHKHAHSKETQDWHQYDSDSPEHHQEVKNHMRESMKKVGRMAEVIKKTKEEHGSVRKGFVKGAHKATVKKSVVHNILRRGKEELPFQKENRQAREDEEADQRDQLELSDGAMEKEMSGSGTTEQHVEETLIGTPVPYDESKHTHLHDQSTREWHQYDSDSPEHHAEVKAHMRDTMKKVGRMAEVIKKTKEEHGSVRKGFVKGASKATVKKSVVHNILRRGKEELPYQQQNRLDREQDELDEQNADIIDKSPSSQEQEEEWHYKPEENEYASHHDHYHSQSTRDWHQYAFFSFQSELILQKV